MSMFPVLALEPLNRPSMSGPGSPTRLGLPAPPVSTPKSMSVGTADVLDTFVCCEPSAGRRNLRMPMRTAKRPRPAQNVRSVKSCQTPRWPRPRKPTLDEPEAGSWNGGPRSGPCRRYPTQWPRQFHRVAEQLPAALTGLLTARVEHPGSTAVPALAAKPNLDMLR